MKKRNVIYIFISVALLTSMVSLSSCTATMSKTHPVEKYYNYTFSQLGDEVMPISGWVSPPPEYTSRGQSYPTRITDLHYSLMKNAGLNMILGHREDISRDKEAITAIELAKKYGIVYFPYDSTLSEWAELPADKIQADIVNIRKTIRKKLELYKTYPAFGGLRFKDEPGTRLYKGMGLVSAVYKEEAKALKINAPLYVNLFPIYAKPILLENGFTDTIPALTRTDLDYDAYLDEFLDSYKPEFLSYDYYPFTYEKEIVMDDYFVNLSMANKKAIENKIPFWVFIQAGGEWDDSTAQSVRVPNETDILWNVNTCLAYGAKGIQYFTYFQPPEYSHLPSENIGLINKEGQKNPMYDYAARANRQIAAVDNVLMKSANMGVIQIGNSPALIPNEGKIEKFRELIQADGGDAIIGCFDYMGKTALYVVNNSVAGDTESQISLSFEGKIKANVVQEGTTVSVNGTKITLNLLPGEGALIELK